MAVSNDKVKAYVAATDARIGALIALNGAYSLPASQEKSIKVSRAQRKVAEATSAYDDAYDGLGLKADDSSDDAETSTAASTPAPAAATTTTGGKTDGKAVLPGDPNSPTTVNAPSTTAPAATGSSKS